MKLSVQATRLALLLCLAVFLGGCGYYFPHVYDGPEKFIYMPNWKNKTSNLGLDAKIYQSLSRWFQKSSSLTITKNKEQADFILAGEILSIDLPSVSYGADARAREVKIWLTVRYVLKDLKTGELLWEEPQQILTEAYSVDGGSAAIASNEIEALKLIVDNLSESIYLETMKIIRKQSQTGV